MKLVDSHAHLDHPQFDRDRDAVLARAREKLEFIVNPGVGIETNRKAVQLSQANPNFVFAAAGLEPPTAGRMQQHEFKAVLDQITGLSDSIVAIGEVGIDYFWEKDEKRRAMQRERFVEIIRLCNGLKKPLVVHTREAMRDTLDILEREAATTVIMHHFDGSPGDAKRVADDGFFASFCTSPVWADKPQRAESLIKAVPVELLLVETDSPFNCPERGRRNEPVFVDSIFGLVSGASGAGGDVILRNSLRAFGIRR
jgi:TatD DNase family protein